MHERSVAIAVQIGTRYLNVPSVLVNPPLQRPSVNRNKGPRGLRLEWHVVRKGWWHCELGYVKCTQWATDGTPSVSVRNSMYQPGGAMFRSFGTFAWSVTGGAAVKETSTSRCVPLKE